MSEKVNVPSLTMMISTVSEESLVRNTHTHGLGSTLKLAVTYDIANKQKEDSNEQSLQDIYFQTREFVVASYRKYNIKTCTTSIGKNKL